MAEYTSDFVGPLRPTDTRNQNTTREIQRADGTIVKETIDPLGNVLDYEVVKEPQKFGNIFGDTGAGTSGGGGGGAAAAARNRLIYNGRDYGFEDDQGARLNYFNDFNKEAVGSANQTYNRFKQGINQNRENLDYNRQRALEQLEQRKREIAQQRDNYFLETQKQGEQFVDDKLLGDVNRGVGFGRRASNAFQSSQATSQDFSDRKLMEGLADQERAKQQTTESFTNFFGDLDKTGQDMNRQYIQDKNSFAQAENDALFQRDNFINQARNRSAQELIPLDLKQGTFDINKYQLKPFSNVNTTQANLEEYKPITTFGNPAAGTTPGGEVGGVGKIMQPKKIAPLDEWFGYKADDREKNYFEQAMRGA